MTPAMILIVLAAAQQPSLSLPDRRVMPGETVQLTGAELPAGRMALAVAGERDTTALGPAVVTAGGGLSHTIAIPASLRPGAYRLLATAGNRVVASLDIVVLDDSASNADRDSAASIRYDTGAAVPASRDTESTPAQSAGTLLGYDWPRLHAALNDLPAALLVFGLLFELAAIVTGRESLRGAGFWSLLAGTAGMAVAATAGLMSESRVAHDDVAHAVMTRHKTIAIVSFALFLVLTVWRLVRRQANGRAERLAWSGFAAVAVGLMIYASHLGGSLVFDHALGVSSPTLRTVLERRGDMPVMDMSDSSGADSTARANPGRPHRDRPGAAPHSH